MQLHTDKAMELRRLHEGCIPLQLPEDRHILVAGPIKRYPGLQMNDTDSPVQYREPSFCPLNGEPGSPQLTKANKDSENIKEEGWL